MYQMIYLIIRNPINVNGRVSTYPGGEIDEAYFGKENAEKHCDNRHRVEPEIVNIEEAKAKALKKLDGLDKLVLGLAGDRWTPSSFRRNCETNTD